jgi:predicted extracellular nuclease
LFSFTFMTRLVTGKMKWIVSVFFISVLSINAQDSTFTPTSSYQANKSLKPFERRNKNAIRVAFYNVENLFDTENDSLTRDDDFTPTGVKGWGTTRYREKLSNIYKVLIALGGWDPPGIIGLCEIENRHVLYELIQTTPLRKFDYQIIHQDSPDRRGIDVGLIYRPDQYRPVSEEFIQMNFPFAPDSRTREILYSKGVVFEGDTLHIFVNHWPSKFGGAQATVPNRMYVAQVLRAKVDSIFAINPMANVIITGDFNDEPGDKSLLEGLLAKKDTVGMRPGDLLNLMYPAYKKGTGTEKFQNHWAVLDMFIVSYSLMFRTDQVNICSREAYIFNPPFLIVEDEKWLGTMPFRTYAGPKYLGGYSDHFPVFLDLIPGN